MDYRKNGLSAADNYAHAVGTWRVAVMLRAHHEGSDGPLEVRIEDGRFETWDDVTEVRRDGVDEVLHAWQIRRVRSFDRAALTHLLRTLHEQPAVHVGHLGIEKPVSVMLEPRGRRLSLLSLGTLSESLADPAIDLLSAEIDETQAQWVRCLSGELKLDNLAVKKLLSRFRVVLLGDLDEISARAIMPLKDVAEDGHEAIFHSLHGYLWNNFSGPLVQSALSIYERLFASSSFRLRPTHHRRCDARREYLAALDRFDAHRQPLRGNLHGETSPGGVRMRAVEIPVLLTAAAGEHSSGARGASVRETLTLLEVLDRRNGAGEPSFCCVVGEVGAGKSTMLEQAAAQLAERARRGSDAPLPMLVTAADLPLDISKRVGRYSHLLQPSLSTPLERARSVYLVDAYDELDATTREQVDAAIELLLDDGRTAGVVVFTRSIGMPSGVLARERYDIVPWGAVAIEAFLRRWSAASSVALPAELGQRELRLLANPLTATLYLAHRARFGEGEVSRTGLFCAMIESFFRAWAEGRPGAAKHGWTEVAPVFEELAYELLRSDRRTVSEADLSRVLQRVAPREAELVRRLAREELGLLVRSADGTYEFLLRSLAEHLAGSYMTRLSEDEVQSLAAAGWAEEPARHCIGLYAIRGRDARALRMIEALCEPPSSELDTVSALRRVGVAARAAADIGDTVVGAAHTLADAVLQHFADGSSTWRPREAQRFARDLLSSGSAITAIVRQRIQEFLDTGSDAAALTYIDPELRDLYHRDNVVRAVAVRRLAERPDVPVVRNLLLAMMEDHGQDDLTGTSVAVEAALGLRSAARDEAFASFLPYLRDRLNSRSQIASAAAACALRPGEADPRALAAALQHHSLGFVVPQAIWDELGEAEGGRAAIEEFPLSANKGMFALDPAEQEARAHDARSKLSPFIRSVLIRALGVSSDLDEDQVARMVDAVRTRGAGELEALAEQAKQGNTIPLVDLFWEVRPFDPPVSPGRFIFLHFTPGCAEHLAVAVNRHPEVLSAFIDLWKRSSGSVLPFGDYPAQVLEPFLEHDPHAAEVYAEWLPRALGGLLPMPQISATALANPVVRAAAEAFVLHVIAFAFDGLVRDGKREYLAPVTTSGVLSRLRSVWLTDGVTADRLAGWLRDADPTKVEAALNAFGPADLPERQHEVVVEWARRAIDEGSVHEKFLQLNAILFCADAGRVAEVRAELLDICRGRDPARFAAGAALALHGADDEVHHAVGELAQTWPDRNWGFWYGRLERVVPALVAAAPEAWAARAAALGAQAGTVLAKTVLDHLPRHAQVSLLGRLAASACQWPLPWLLSDSMTPFRLLDATLEMLYHAGFDIEELIADEIDRGP